MRLSVIIPVLDEAQAIGPALERLREIAPEAELVVVDGGSTDGTPGLAAPHARVVTSAPGRAVQLNHGAAVARGDWLLFLHVDTALPQGFQAALAEAQRRGLQTGAFGLRIVGRHPLLPLLSRAATLRTRWRRIALGDQAIFVARALFTEVGGFPELPLMEDYAFSLLLKRRGLPLYLAPQCVTTSGRRWDQCGFFRTWWQMRRLYLQYHWRRGDVAELAARYHHVR